MHAAENLKLSRLLMTRDGHKIDLHGLSRDSQAEMRQVVQQEQIRNDELCLFAPRVDSHVPGETRTYQKDRTGGDHQEAASRRGVTSFWFWR